MSLSPYVALYAQELNRRLCLEIEISETRQDLDRVISHVESLQNQNTLLQNQITELSNAESTESLLLSLQQENEALRAQLSSVQSNSDVSRAKVRESESLSDCPKRSSDLETDNQRLHRQVSELNKTLKEDQKRIENLYLECGNLSGKLNEAMELMEKYKTGYMNMKRRNDTLEKPRVVIQQVDQLTKSSGYYKCRQIHATFKQRCDRQRSQAVHRRPASAAEG